ncbi:unnamed protein product [Coregonus sp. 'balchen']|nr:unnamed protein product [Coregonus sp. 'balchen']
MALCVSILALRTLPAPVNVTITSLNFQSVLRWIPGPGTPSGTIYSICNSEDNIKPKHQTNTTNQKLDLKYPKERAILYVQASHKRLVSPCVNINFTPFTKSTSAARIGPPTFSLDGCGSCLVINITLPEMRTIKDVYGSTLSFSIFWKKAGETQFQETLITHSSYVLENLKVGVELKTHLPRALTALVEGYFVTPERIVPDLVSISSEPEEQGKTLGPKTHHNRENTNQEGEEEEEEEEEEEGGGK